MPIQLSALWLAFDDQITKSNLEHINKTRTSKAGAISKVQKAQNICGKCRIVPKNVKGEETRTGNYANFERIFGLCFLGPFGLY